MMWQMYALAGLGAVFVAIYARLHWQGKKLAEKQKEIEMVKAEARAVAEEMENAEKSKQIEQANRRLTAHGVDDQLQSKGYFRED
ncbi:DUF2681 domain-containing protein [Avibacterium paragallinarum]|uniref:Protein of uncharacterized function (DUF2681) n=1 Tax=Avibacterium paragallinarum TaxID=728 RepID=A0A377I4K2_AVIPA|nr:DUF2681 domain-containing protein [Avibacterium paragallinarum]POY47167.1 DUF2681 domain-containing protein [Avibacterium paragallinarum]RZN76385.1 DUF2681 domain-containing protein [Avibacterium paragallinarum]STO70265.1 Protein of uncharacterised function (DUF2681) [Avibacterium paragallinarum]